MQCCQFLLAMFSSENSLLLTLICFLFLQCDLLDMPAIGQLEKDTKYALVYQLLKIFLTQRLDGYLEFQAGNSALLKSYGNVFLNWSFPFYWLFHWLICLQISIIFNSFSCNGVGLVHEDCIAKMRLMSLVDLGSNESGQIPYGLIKDTLQVYFLTFLLLDLWYGLFVVNVLQVS